MLNSWQHHSDFQTLLLKNLSLLWPFHRPEILSVSTLIDKVWLMDLDNAMEVLEPAYPVLGRPAQKQTQILRSLIVMLDRGVHSITVWVEKTRTNPVIASICGFNTLDDAPGVGCYYDFFDRFWPQEEPDPSKLRQPQRKPRKKLKKGEKLPPKHAGIVKKLADKAMEGRTFSNRPEFLIQSMFAQTAVLPSANMGLLGPPNDIGLSGDSTAFYSGGSSYGIKVCVCKQQGIYNCKCSRRFSDPDASWGWDSYREIYYYGRSLYTLSASSAKYDLPILLRFSQAQRHDSVMSIVSLSEALKLYPTLDFISFSGDSAQDAYPIYQLLHHWDMIPFIPLNNRNNSSLNNKLPVRIDDNGIPICAAEHPMVYWGFCKGRCRIKWRCPLVCGKIGDCLFKDVCTSSPYGRVTYTRPNWDLRLFTPVPRGSAEWKAQYNKHSMSERVNKRIVEDYEPERTKVRGTKRSYWWATLAAMNIHADAWIREIQPNIVSSLPKDTLVA